MKEAEDKKNQTVLDYCRQQEIAFTENDKTMYNLQSTRNLHKLYENFMNKETKIVDLSKVEMPVDQKGKLSLPNFANTL